jgi:hypothetical protein
LLSRVHLDHAGAPRRLCPDLLLHPLEQERARLLPCQRRDVLDGEDLLLFEAFHLPQSELGLLFAALQAPLALLDFVDLAIEVFLFLAITALLGLDLDAHFAHLLLGSGQDADGVLLGLEQNRFLFGVRAGARVGGALLDFQQ